MPQAPRPPIGHQSRWGGRHGFSSAGTQLLTGISIAITTRAALIGASAAIPPEGMTQAASTGASTIAPRPEGTTPTGGTRRRTQTEDARPAGLNPCARTARPADDRFRRISAAGLPIDEGRLGEAQQSIGSTGRTAPHAPNQTTSDWRSIAHSALKLKHSTNRSPALPGAIRARRRISYHRQA